MSLPGWIFLVLHVAAIWGCVMILVRPSGIILGPDHSFPALFFYVAAPWIAPLTGFIAWRTTRRQRRMQAARSVPQALSRGNAIMMLPDDRPTLMERLSLASLLLALIVFAARLTGLSAGWALVLLGTVWLSLKAARWCVPAPHE